jgi:hypothetical protein
LLGLIEDAAMATPPCGSSADEVAAATESALAPGFADLLLKAAANILGVENDAGALPTTTLLSTEGRPCRSFPLASCAGFDAMKASELWSLDRLRLAGPALGSPSGIVRACREFAVLW